MNDEVFARERMKAVAEIIGGIQDFAILYGTTNYWYLCRILNVATDNLSATPMSQLENEQTEKAIDAIVAEMEAAPQLIGFLNRPPIQTTRKDKK